jgi:hypothetical protein
MGGKAQIQRREITRSETWYPDRMMVDCPKGSAGLQTGCRAGVRARIGSGSIAKSHRLGASGVRHAEVRLCFERPRLQSCRKRPKMRWALAPEESRFHEFNPLAGLGK